MSSPSKEDLLRQGQALESAGRVDDAVAHYLRHHLNDAAVMALVNTRRYGEGARLILRVLGVTIPQAALLDERRKATAKKAAVLFAQAGEVKSSVELFLAVGAPSEAATVLERAGDAVGASRLRSASYKTGTALPMDDISGSSRTTVRRIEESGDLASALQAYVQLKDFGNAGRVAMRLDRPEEAAKFFLEGGFPYEAGYCLQKAGHAAKALEALVRLPANDGKYRKACLLAATIAADANILEFKLDDFLERFIETGPQGEAEIVAFRNLASLYERHDFPENAEQLLERILAVRPNDEDAQTMLAALQSAGRGTARSFDRIVREDASFRGVRSPTSGRSARGSLPPLPSLDDDGAKPAGTLPNYGPPSGAVPLPSGPAAEAGAVGLSHSTHMGTGGGLGGAVGPGSLPPPAEVGGLASGLTPGFMVARRYVIQREIGRGGMAAVYQALDSEINETVALKFFFGSTDSPDLLARFKQELALARKLIHPNIVQVYDIGTHGGAKFISMELMQGKDYQDHLASGPTLFDALGYFLQALAGLGHAHDKGVVHRDVKPSNFFVTNEGVLKVMDFGIAKHMHSPGMTKTSFIAGTPDYMSPEQITKFAAVTHLTDIYALGIIAYELFTGTLPFQSDETVPLLMMHLNQAPEPPSQRYAGLPPEVDAIVLKAIEKEPAKRYQHCREMAADLEKLREKFRPGGG